MKTIKKLGVLALVLVMALSFAACGKDESSAGKNPASAIEAKTEIEKYVEENEQLLVESFEQGFAGGSGMGCTTTVKGVGNEIMFTVCIDDLDGLTAEDKATMQSAFDSMNGEMKEAFSGVKTELPSIEGIVIYICEEDGDKVATIDVDF